MKLLPIITLFCLVQLCCFISTCHAEMATVPTSFHEIIDGGTKKLRVVVQISEYLISKTEITQEQYEKVVGTNPARYKGKQRPVENVSWWDAIRYCNLRSKSEGLQPCYDLENGRCDFTQNGYRLPTEWEWKVACAGADAQSSPNTANIGVATTRSSRELMNMVNEKGTKKVGNYPPNKFGLYDMVGNVWEWCNDNYNEVKDIPEPSLIDPTGPDRGLEKVIRGGSFISSPSLYRLHHGARCLRPKRKSPFTGFRVCRSTAKWGKLAPKQYGPDWFKPYTQAPKGLEDCEKLPSLLLDSKGKTLATIEDWEKKRASLKEKWLRRLGVPPSPNQPPEKNVVCTFDGGCYTGKILYLQWEQDLFIKIVLMMPKRPASKPTPAVIVNWYDVDAAVGKNLGGYLQQDLAELKAFGRMIVQQGYIAVAVGWWGLSDESYEESTAKVKLKFPNCTGLGKTIWDTARVVDYLYTLPEVDKNRIGCIGHCMAGITTIYSMAFEERIAVAVACGSNCSVFHSNYYDYWYLGEELLGTIDKATDQQELFAITAPRPFLLALGKGNYIDACWPYINASKEVYRLYEKPENLGYFYDKNNPPPSREMVHRMCDWLTRFLDQQDVTPVLLK